MNTENQTQNNTDYNHYQHKGNVNLSSLTSIYQAEKINDFVEIHILSIDII